MANCNIAEIFVVIKRSREFLHVPSWSRLANLSKSAGSESPLSLIIPKVLLALTSSFRLNL